MAEGNMQAHPFTLHPSPITRRPGPGSWALRRSVPAHSPHDTFDNLVVALPFFPKSDGACFPCCPAALLPCLFWGPVAPSHLACGFKVAEGSLSTPVRAALGHGQAAHAHCNFAIILLLPSPPRRFLILLLAPLPPSRRVPSRAALPVSVHAPRRHSSPSLPFFSGYNFPHVTSFIPD